MLENDIVNDDNDDDENDGGELKLPFGKTRYCTTNLNQRITVFAHRNDLCLCSAAASPLEKAL